MNARVELVAQQQAQRVGTLWGGGLLRGHAAPRSAVAAVGIVVLRLLDGVEAAAPRGSVPRPAM